MTTRIDPDRLEDRVVYVMDDDNVFQFAVYCKDKHTFLGVHQTSEEMSSITELREESPHDPTHGHYGEVVPVEATDIKAPDWISLALTVDQGYAWVDNQPLLEFLLELVTEEDDD